jgi:CheY-like chemotaxis protein
MLEKHTILYAEDDQDDVYMVKKAFEAHDHIQVMHADNGSEALQMLNGMLQNNIKPCLVILDINMPVMSGKEALLKMKENREFDEIPVILFSTSSSKIDQEFAAQWGVELFTKPLNYSDLETIIREFVGKCNFEINKLKN